MGALVFALPQRQMQRVLMPQYCVVHSANEAAPKLLLVEFDESQALRDALLLEASSKVESYLKAPPWSVLEAQLRHSKHGNDVRCSVPPTKCRSEADEPPVLRTGRFSAKGIGHTVQKLLRPRQ